MFDDFDDENDFDAPGVVSLSVAQAFLPPRETSTLLGHAAEEKLILSLFQQNTLPHALILSGPKGIGKSVFAFRLARFLFKQGGQGDEGQGGLFGDEPAPIIPTSMDVSPDDPVFRRVLSGGHADLLVIERPMDEKKGQQKDSIDVETVRAIAPFFRMTASEGGWRVVIIDDCETMNRNAQNAILKILEEPPPKSILILICHRLGAMIPTIRSRCRTLSFAPPDRNSLCALIEQGTGVQGDDLALLADLSDGSLGMALSIHEQGGLQMFQKLLEQLSHWPKWNWLDLHGLSSITGGAGAEQEYHAMEHLLIWCAERLLKAKALGTDTLPRPMMTKGILAMLDHYSLEEWVEICDKLKEHFRAIDMSNLDRRQGALGAFSALST